MRHIITCLLLIFSTSVLAAETCIPVKPQMHDKNLLISYTGSKDSAEVYFFKNISQQGVWLDHPTNKEMKAGWSTYLQANNWSSFLLNRKNFELSCATIEPGKVDYLDCSKVISVCKPQSVSFKAPPKSTFWLVEDKAWDELLKLLEKRGVTVKN